MVYTLQESDSIYYSSGDDVYHYYKYFEETPVTKKHLLVIVRHLNKEGFVITSFFVARIHIGDKGVIYE